MRRCEMQGCEEPASGYGGLRSANDWAGYVCLEHGKSLAWWEEVRFLWCFDSNAECEGPVEWRDRPDRMGRTARCQKHHEAKLARDSTGIALDG